MSTIIDLLGTQAGYYLDHVCKTIDKKLIHIPEPNMIDKAWVDSDRNIRTLESLQALYGHGRLANTGYVSILPVDQGIEHSAGASFAPATPWHPHSEFWELWHVSTPIRFLSS